ncbi:helix-turn-helix domain-containing protein [Lunatimonas lonarensis]|nr:helix-turn-helix domain-containing protein [Lunatimonas lonarensis]
MHTSHFYHNQGRKCFWIILGLVLLVFQSAYSQDIGVKVRHFSNDEGLLTPMVNEMHLSDDGYLWLATLGALVRFDGTDFKAFMPTNAEPKSINFTSLAFDEKGKVYAVGTDPLKQRRLYSLSHGSIHLQPVKMGEVFPKSIRALIPSEAGEFALVTEEENIFIFAEGTITKVFSSPLLTPITHLKPTPEYLFIKTISGEIYRLDRKGNAVRVPPSEFAQQVGNQFQVASVDIDLTSKNIAASDCFFPTQPSLIPRAIDPILENAIFAFPFPRAHLTWILQKKSISLFDGMDQNWLDFSTLLGSFPKAQGIKCAVMDPSGQIWLGTNDGIIAIKPTFSFSQHLFTDRDAKGNAYSFRGITEWKGSLYANSYSGIVKHSFSDQNSNLLQPKIKFNHLLAAYSATDTALWMADGQQLYRFYDTDSEPVVYNLPQSDSFPYNSLEIWSMLQDQKKRLWLGTSVGLAVLDSLESKIRFVESKDTTAKINHISQAKDGLLLCSSSGIQYFDFAHGFDAAEHQYKDLQTLTEGIPIYHLWEDEVGTFWLASHGKGLLQWRPGEGDMKIWDEGTGLGSNHFHAVYEDYRGSLWLPSDDGLYVLDPKSGRAIRLTKQNGLTDSEFNRISHYRDEKGTLYFGGVAGINRITPVDFYRFVPDTVEQLGWDSANLLYIDGNNAEAIQSFPVANHPIELDASVTNVNVKLLNLMDFTLFEYTWKSASDHWEKSHEPILHISHLPSRSDELLVRAFDDLGNYAGSISIPFKVRPAGWIYTIISILLVCMVVSIPGWIAYRRWFAKRILTDNPYSKLTNLPAELDTKHVDPFMEKMEEVLKENISLPEFGVSQLSEALCLSRKSLYRKTNQLIGKNPNDFIKEKRLEYARKLLSISELNISEITFRAGFSSSSYFSNCYKKHYGLTPKEHRKQISAKSKNV